VDSTGGRSRIAKHANRPSNDRRIETTGTAIPGSKQPYHAAERRGVERAKTLIRQCRDSSTPLAMRAVSAMVAELKQNGLTVVGAGILLASGCPLPDLA